MVMVMVMVINSALVRTHQSTYYGSFGPVLPPGWVWLRRLHPLGSRASRCGGAHPTSARDAMPTSSPGSRCCIIKPLLAVGWGGGWGRGLRPHASNPGPSGASPLPPFRFCARVLFAIRTLAPPVSLAPSCHLRVRRRPRIGSSVPLSSLASHVSLSRHTLLVYPLPSALVLHADLTTGWCELVEE